MLEFVGGRAIHPVNVRVGGFYSVPTQRDLAPLAERLRRALDLALDTVGGRRRSISPTWNSNTTCSRCTIRAATRSSAANRLRPAGCPSPPAISAHVVEEQVPHSTALHATLDGRRYLAGPLARYSLNSGSLSPVARQAAPRPGSARSAATRSAASWSAPSRSSTPSKRRCASSTTTSARPARRRGAAARRNRHGVSEAPRGLLYHRYELDADGLIRAATIIPPTSQNQAAIEDDLRRVVSANLDRMTPR